MSEEKQTRKPLTEAEVKLLRQKRDMAYRRKLQQLREAGTAEERDAILEQTHYNRKVQTPQTTAKKWENYRYHYGVLTIVVLVCVAMVVWLIHDVATVEKYDINITSTICYEGTISFDEVSLLLADYYTDTDGDGNVDIFIENLQLDRANIDDADYTTVMAATVKLSAAMMDREYIIYFVDEYYYEMMLESDVVFVDLSQYTDAEGVDGTKYDLTTNELFDSVDTDELYLVMLDPSQYDEDEQEDIAEQFELELQLVLDLIGD